MFLSIFLACYPQTMEQVVQVVLTIQVAIASYVHYCLSKYDAIIAATCSASFYSSQDNGDKSSDQFSGSLTRSFPRLPSIFDRFGPKRFVNSTWHLTHWEKLKLSLMSTTVFPIRLVRMLLSILLTAGCVMICMALGADPQTPTRYLLQWPVRLMSRSVLFAYGYYYIPTTGQLAAPNAAPIIVASHFSVVDVHFLIYFMGACPVAEVANLRNPVIGPILEVLQCISVDRSCPASRAATKRRIIDRARALAAGEPGRHMAIFPEASTQRVDSLIHFKASAFSAGVPVQPVFLNFAHCHFDPCWVSSGPDLGFLLFRMLCQFVNHCSVRYLPPTAPDAADERDPRAFARRVRKAMAEEGSRARSDVQVTNCSVVDAALQFVAFQNSLPPDAVVVETQAIKVCFLRLHTLSWYAVPKGFGWVWINV